MNIKYSGENTSKALIKKFFEFLAKKVSTVNGVRPDADGNVTLTAENVGAKSSSYKAPVDSVNGKTGAVELSARDVKAVESVNGIGPDEEGNVDVRKVFESGGNDYITFAVSEKGVRITESVHGSYLYFRCDGDEGKGNVTVRDVDGNVINHLYGTTNKPSPIDLGAYPVGSTYTTASSSLSPASFLGGTWELIDRLYATASIADFFTPASDVTFSGGWAVPCGNTIQLKVGLSCNAALADGSVVLGTFDCAKMGMEENGFPFTTYVLGHSDAGNGFSNATIGTDGTLTHVDCVTKDGTGNIPAGSAIIYGATINVMFAKRLDRFCNQFVWKRVS